MHSTDQADGKSDEKTDDGADRGPPNQDLCIVIRSGPRGKMAR